MKKAQSWAGHCYTDRFKGTRHLIVVKTRKRQMFHCKKGQHNPMGPENDARVKALPEWGRASNTRHSSTPQVRI